jgi:hypothetical protein
VEDVIDAGTTKAFHGAFLHKFTFYHLAVGISEPIYEIEHNRSLVTFDRIAIDIELDYLYFFVLQKLINLS